MGSMASRIQFHIFSASDHPFTERLHIRRVLQIHRVKESEYIHLTTGGSFVGCLVNNKMIKVIIIVIKTTTC